MAIGVPPDLVVKHSALKVCVGVSSVDSDAEDEDGCVQDVAGSADRHVEHPGGHGVRFVVVNLGGE